MPLNSPTFTHSSSNRLRLPQGLQRPPRTPRTHRFALRTPQNPPTPPKTRPARPRRPLTAAVFSRRTTVAQIAICVLLVAFTVLANLIFTPSVLAQRHLATLARSYYEDYFYPNFAANYSSEIRQIAFRPYADGFAPVTLRTLITFDHGRFGHQAPDFATCDPIATTVTIIPVAPFAKTDYRLETTLACGAK